MTTDAEEFLKDDGLTDEERAALAEDEEDDSSGEEGDAVEAEPEDNEDKTVSEEKDNAEEASQVVEAEIDASPSRDDGQPVERIDTRPIFTANEPEDVAAKQAAIDAEKETVFEKFDSGEITAKEYQIKLDALNRQEIDLKISTAKFEIATDMARQQAQNNWMAEVDKFIAETNDGVYSKSKLAWIALDAAVREMGADPKNHNMSERSILEKAHERVSNEFGWGKKETAPAEKTEAKEAKPAPKAKIEIPPTLAKMPAAEMNDTSGGRFAALDRLMDTDPIGYEEAIGKLSKSEQNAYLASR